MKYPVVFGNSRALTTWLCLGTLAAMATIVAALASRAPPSRAANLKLIYVGAEDCAPCRAWQNGDGAAFQQSAEFAHITYFAVKAAHLHDVLKDENWPQEIRGLKERLRKSDGVPLWLVVSNDNVVQQRFGAPAWRDKILPAIRSELR